MYKLGQNVQPFDKYFTRPCRMSGTVLSFLKYQTKMLEFLPQKDHLLQGTKDSKQIIRRQSGHSGMDTDKTERLKFSEFVMIHFLPNSMQQNHISYWEGTNEKKVAGN